MSGWKRHWVNYVAALLFALWLAGQAIFQVFVADTPRPAFLWLNGANLLQLFALVVGGALLLVTNTRRPAGIDPNAPPLPPSVHGPAKEVVDPFLLTTDELAEHERRRLSAAEVPPSRGAPEPHTPRRPAVLDEEGELYGRRATDIPIRDIKRVIAALEQIKSAGADPEEVLDVPEWARELQRQAAENGDLPPDVQSALANDEPPPNDSA